VTVYGWEFFDSTLLQCRFGTNTRVPGQFISSTEVLCVSNTHTPGVVALEVTNNNQDFTTLGFSYTYDRTFPSVGRFGNLTMLTLFCSSCHHCGVHLAYDRSRTRRVACSSVRHQLCQHRQQLGEGSLQALLTICDLLLRLSRT
jgi:hypothetical protein